jgi:hypothetical protein
MTKRQINLEFQVKSTDPHRSTSKAVTEIPALRVDLEAAVSHRLPGAKVRIRRAEGIPGIAELQHILLQIDWNAVEKGAEEAISGFLTTQFLTLLKNRIKLLQAKKVAGPAKRPLRKVSSTATKKSPARPKKKGK